MKNEIVEIQQMLKRQMHRLDEAVSKEINVEINRSGALSQNAQAYLKAVSINLKVKEMTKNNPSAEKTILKEIGVIDEK